jgi:hypothetical protein
VLEDLRPPRNRHQHLTLALYRCPGLYTSICVYSEEGIRSIIGILDHFDQGSIREFEEIDLALQRATSGGYCSYLICRDGFRGGRRPA